MCRSAYQKCPFPYVSPASLDEPVSGMIASPSPRPHGGLGGVSEEGEGDGNSGPGRKAGRHDEGEWDEEEEQGRRQQIMDMTESRQRRQDLLQLTEAAPGWARLAASADEGTGLG